MTLVTASIEPFRVLPRTDVTHLSCLLLVAAAAGLAWVKRDFTWGVYSLSFWHYYVYVLAYRYGAIPLPLFKRDAVFLKTVALVALGAAYVQSPLNLFSLTVVALGFSLNLLAAWALGSDRTYYGYEVADLPRLHITRFPYSWISHPMIVGNMAAYGGTLINADFRLHWWPLACIHMLLNLALLFMELVVKPLRLFSQHDLGSLRGSPPEHLPMKRLVRIVVFVGLGMAFGVRDWEDQSAHRCRLRRMRHHLHLFLASLLY